MFSEGRGESGDGGDWGIGDLHRFSNHPKTARGGGGEGGGG